MATIMPLLQAVIVGGFALFGIVIINNIGPVPLSRSGCVQAGAQKLGVIEASYASAIIGVEATVPSPNSYGVKT